MGTLEFFYARSVFEVPPCELPTSHESIRVNGAVARNFVSGAWHHDSWTFIKIGDKRVTAIHPRMIRRS